MRLRLTASILAVAVALLAGGLRAPAAPEPPKEAVAVGTGGAVASVDADATRAGIQVLREGGNAVDAAVAANAVLGVTEPFVAGVGGGGFMVVYLAREHRVITIDGRETAPQAFPEDAFIDPATGQPIPFFPQRVTSGMAVGVPGTLATWSQAASRFGTMPLGRLLRPAIAVAERGFVVDNTFRGQISDNLTRLDAFTPSRELFLTPDGQPPAIGSIFRNPQLAQTYRLIARDGPGALYQGPIGAALVDTVRHPPVAPDSQLGFPVRPGVMTIDDLARYTAPLRAPTQSPTAATTSTAWRRRRAGARRWARRSTSSRASTWGRRTGPWPCTATSRLRSSRSPTATAGWATPTSSTSRSTDCSRRDSPTSGAA